MISRGSAPQYTRVKQIKVSTLEVICEMSNSGPMKSSSNCAYNTYLPFNKICLTLKMILSRSNLTPSMMISMIMIVMIGTPTMYIHQRLVFVNLPERSSEIPSHVMSAFVRTTNTPVLMKVAIVNLVMIDFNNAVLFLYLSKLANFLIEVSITKLITEIAIEIAIVSKNLQMVSQ